MPRVSYVKPAVVRRSPDNEKHSWSYPPQRAVAASHAGCKNLDLAYCSSLVVARRTPKRYVSSSGGRSRSLVGEPIDTYHYLTRVMGGGRGANAPSHICIA
jgi:hypothetical protein